MDEVRSQFNRGKGGGRDYSLHPYASKGQAAAQKAERGWDDELKMAEMNSARQK